MNPIPINLAVEDALSQAVIRRVLAGASREYAIGFAYGGNGRGYLQKMIAAFNNAARATPFLVLTDLDDEVCPATLVEEWLPQQPNGNLMFRVAVREVEAWILGDQAGLATFLGVRRDSITETPELLPDPKKYLIDVASRCRDRDVRGDIVPPKGSVRVVGPNYNGRLVGFVSSTWDPAAAAAKCPSLARLMNKVEGFKPTWEEL